MLLFTAHRLQVPFKLWNDKQGHMLPNDEPIIVLVFCSRKHLQSDTDIDKSICNDIEANTLYGNVKGNQIYNYMYLYILINKYTF